MKIRALLTVVLAGVILVGGLAWAGEACCKAKTEKKEGTCQTENKDKKCEKAKDPNCPKAAETKPKA